MDFLKVLLDTYQDSITYSGRPDYSRLAYIGDYIFEFETDDPNMAELFAKKALEICRVISRGEAQIFTREPNNYQWFLVMVNIPFFRNKIDSGPSIRNIWWTHNQDYLNIYSLFICGEMQNNVSFSHDEWIEFIEALLIFGKVDDLKTNQLEEIYCLEKSIMLESGGEDLADEDTFLEMKNQALMSKTTLASVIDAEGEMVAIAPKEIGELIAKLMNDYAGDNEIIRIFREEK